MNDEDRVFIRQILQDYRKENTELSCQPLGAGSKFQSSSFLKVRELVKRSSINFRYGRVLYNLARYFQPNTILELGTGVGISTLYLALGSKNAEIYTIEGCNEKLKFARERFNRYGFSDIKGYNGKFEDQLLSLLNQIKKLDLVFLDGDHQYDKTIDYFERISSHCHNDTVIVLDDIHWSSEMEKAWRDIKMSADVAVTLDLFQLGVVFFKKELTKQNFILKF